MNKEILPILYSKLSLLICSIILGIVIYCLPENSLPQQLIKQSDYWGTFLAGAFLTHSFTLSPAIAVLLILSKEQSFWLSSLIATTGMIIGNVISYNLFRLSYHKELFTIGQQPLIKKIRFYTKKYTPRFIKIYILPILAAIISVTPLPDELAILLIQDSEKVSITLFTTVTTLMTVFGATLIILIGKLL
jgi:membrane protein YqaA with SNARE-associated domain